MQSRDNVNCFRGSSLAADLPDPNPCLLGIIRDWMRKRGDDLPSRWKIDPPDERFAKYCADAYQAAQHTPAEFRTRESYRIFITELNEQFQLFSHAGYTFSLWRGDGQPYRDSREMRADALRHHRLFVIRRAICRRIIRSRNQQCRVGHGTMYFAQYMISSPTPPPGSNSDQRAKRTRFDFTLRC